MPCGRCSGEGATLMAAGEFLGPAAADFGAAEEVLAGEKLRGVPGEGEEPPPPTRPTTFTPWIPEKKKKHYSIKVYNYFIAWMKKEKI